MLSLILYGRNDAHGYNLHKRAAISLNALAEVVDDPDDEIIFVDYNTPDELPTFLETIADTLTERAKKYIRIIRVRPEFHKRYARITNLVALESQSRNIAIRRANPANRWILSTNTDMIFIPQQRDATLSNIVAQLSEGFYHLPRFELPEGFWERSNRLDPLGMIEQLREFGKRYHLNEVVYGAYDNVYEAPGDFQLFLREDLYRIGGFDETMLKGWHVDTNTARRMKLLRGKVETLFPQLCGYHCGHTRQATSLHGARRTENSLDTYARNLSSPYWTTEDTWGVPDQMFEEVRLTKPHTSFYIGALESAIPSDGPDYTEATYNETTYCQEGFDAAHILPHLGDVLFNMPPGQTVFMIGSDRELVAGLGKFIASPPMNSSLIVCADEDSPGPDGTFPSLTLAGGIERADILVVQYPNVRTASPSQRADLEWYAQKALEEIIQAERRRDRADRRRVIVINGVHSLLQDLIGEALDAAAMPYSTRLRQGRVFDPYWQMHPWVDAAEADRPTYARLGRLRVFSRAEIDVLSRVFVAGDGSPNVDGWERLAPEIVAIASQRDFLKDRLGADTAQAAAIEGLARQEIKRAEERVAGPLVAVPARTDTSNRICSGADWESPEWSELAIRYFGERAYSQTTRSRWLWERISLILELRRRLPAEQRPWVLVVSEGPDPIAAMAAHQGFRVAYAETETLLNGASTPEWSSAFRMLNVVLPGAILPLDRVPAGSRFAAMLAPGSTLFWRERERAHRVIKKIATIMTSEAHLGVSSLVHINSSLGSGALSLAEFETAFASDGVMSHMNISGDAPVDARIPLDTAVRFAPNDRETESAPGLSFGFGPNANLSLGILWGRFPTTSASSPTPAPAADPAEARAAPAESEIKTGTLSEQQSAEHSPTVAHASRPLNIRRNDADFPSARAFANAMAARVLVYPALFNSLRRNLLPSLISSNIQERSALRVLIAADPDEKVRFGVPIADVGVGIVCLYIAVSGVDDVEAIAAVFVGSNGVTEGVVTGSRGILSVRFEMVEPLGDGLAVLEINAKALEVSVLSAAREAALMSIA